jgi:hypothetical protein
MKDWLADQRDNTRQRVRVAKKVLHIGSSRAVVPSNFDFEAPPETFRVIATRPQPADRWSEEPIAVPRLRIEYNPVEFDPVEFDQTINEERAYHPKPFDTDEDAGAEIRLLKVVLLEEDEDPASPIHCYILRPRRFASRAPWERIKYTALSYTWGPTTGPSDTNDILIHGEPVCVRRNIWDFLYTMRMARQEGPYWIDALCIDQLRTSEKERQLELMPKIYAKAEMVLVWLGVYDKDAAQGVVPFHRWYTTHKTKPLDIEEPYRYYALKYIIENKYWTRLWIVQEIFMAKKIEVYTGPLRWVFSDLTRLGLERDPDFLAINRKTWDSVVKAKQEWKHQKLDLHEALFRWSGQDCGVTHDKVYGLLGLVAKPRIKIDLSISMLDLLDEVLKLERERIYKKGYKYAIDFTTKLLVSLKIENVESAKTMKTMFLKGYRE